MNTSSARTRTGGLRPTLYRMHSWAGVLVAPFLVAAALTGLAYSFGPVAEEVYYHHELTASEGTHHPVSSAIAAARAVHPDLPLAGAVVSDKAEDSVRVLFKDESLPGPSFKRAVFVDPVTDEILGDMPQYASFHSLPLRTFIDEGHANLWLGEPGRFYSEMAASWLGALTITGLFLLFNKWRRSMSTKNAPRRWHSLIGLVCVPGFLVLTLTGLTWSKTAGKAIAWIRTELSWRPPVPAAGPPVDGPGLAGDAGVDTAIAVARSHGLTGVFDVLAPKGGDVWKITESAAQPWVFSYDAISVNGADGSVVGTVPFSDWPLAAQLTEWLIRAHVGTLFGLLNQIILAATAAGILAAIVLGYIIWYRRGRTGKFGRLPAPRSWQTVPRGWLIVFLIIMAIYAVAAPYFGLSLLIFLAIDAAWRRAKLGTHARSAAHA
ncbi:PepSY-associated TM helix domain-containing protein [Corynebacterium uberis]|uniref:PepSY-associated TM helix domain-containing protein n=1 Tax=Corynebacterium TaxID=1716 RepID=UPI001D0B632F|nr:MULTISPECIES: PepSY domain-containing protein [Corynebacterium]MCZ9310212.1 PepSY domain-containing protein [Corynebacterium sp. c6VSa_13]UDL75429.1 PepSY domain-containing protein [Corynebacterium uberis]UDL77642.1 PepSY domain-containing protein [Corynebacterium uberis]UDL79927.1 PepSY domain-containing protein [Corynebacterium uberis]UDL82058.1 PepSY domain-containing protein [Corynebacterium uberis]